MRRRPTLAFPFGAFVSGEEEQTFTRMGKYVSTDSTYVCILKIQLQAEIYATKIFMCLWIAEQCLRKPGETMFFAIILRDDIDSVTDFFALLFTGYAPHFTYLSQVRPRRLRGEGAPMLSRYTSRLSISHC